MAKRLSISGIRVDDNQQVVLETFDSFKKPFDVVVPGKAEQGAARRATIQPGIETAIFRSSGERASIKPLFAGQLGVQTDTGTMYYGNSTDEGDWYPVNPSQTSVIGFTAASYDIDSTGTGTTPDVTTVQIALYTSDLGPLEYPITIEVQDNETGDAVDPTHYAQTSPNPLVIEIPTGTPSGTEFNYPITFVLPMPDPPKTINLEINVSGQGAELDTIPTTVVNLVLA